MRKNGWDDLFEEGRHVTPELVRIYRDVRSFVDGARNCYTLWSLAVGLKYLLRASFMYGNYDGLNRPPVFDLYIGVNLWKTVNVSDPPDARVVAEAIVVVPDDFVQVCLVNTGSGTPFISGLELRPLKSSIYPQVNLTQGLVLLVRRNFGPTDSTDIVR
ncbi:probable LRR receptor-like serine/threonine-protein kinase At4g29180 [Miscanthus floridulus]|uniref:probable LRR receptor-like serine/threonine-protein kinase At4g29180 n=1 Tax=Miscanthus floridulus TaxID=154761 RepID=UPI0034574CD5